MKSWQASSLDLRGAKVTQHTRMSADGQRLADPLLVALHGLREPRFFWPLTQAFCDGLWLSHEYRWALWQSMFYSVYLPVAC